MVEAKAAITAAGRAQAIKAVNIHLLTEGDTRNRVWIFQEVPRDIIVEAKIEAAVENKSVKALLMDLVEAHWQEMERKGIESKGK